MESLTKSVDQSAISPENPLTAREAEVLALVSLGYTNKEMANALSISVKTIEYHMSSIFKKTQASKRTEAVTNALKFKWLEAS
ncbi:response regulator transcription factor [Halobacteriovorax sp. CON-3]|uniref:response regulator transcription factor n=1 Tax=Halobacteriovorax sp. CON-3 TaxID=3157710 RepID=UPI00372218A0